MADDLFQPDPNEAPALEENKSYVEELVGEGKKFKDAEALARGKVESDRFIANLLREQAELRESLKKRINEEEFLNRLEQVSKPKSPDAGNQPPVEGTQKGTAITPADVEKIIETREAERTRKTNLDQSINRLKELFGDDYKRHVQKQAQTLGVGTDFLTSIAAENPQAFFRLLNVEEAQRTQNREDAFSPPPRSQMGTPPSQPAGKNYAYFQKLRAEKGEAHYFSPSVQQEMWNTLTSMGEEKFYAK